MLSLINYYLSDRCQRKQHCSNFVGQTPRVSKASALVPLSQQSLSRALPCKRNYDHHNETMQLNPAVKSATMHSLSRRKK